MANFGQGLDLVFKEQSFRTIALEALAPFEKEHKAKFKIDYQSSGTKAIWNADSIKRMIQALCTNALKFGNEKPIVVNFLEDEEHVRFSVQNWGTPIHEKALKDLFQPFKLMITKPSNEPGMGLNLSLVKGIVEAHGGNIKVVSNADEGTCFQILLPKKQLAKAI